MRGITFGTPYFETELGRVEPDSEIHFAVALFAASSDPDVGVSRDELASLLWPESTLDAARHNLRQAMYRLRQLGVPVHLKVGQVIMSDTDTEIDLRELVHGPVTRDDLLRIATQDFLPGYAPRLGTRYAAWLQDLRDRTDRVRRHALVEAVREARAQARFRDIHKLAPALLSLDPLNETATFALAEALVMDGSKVEALRMLDEYEQEVGTVSDALRVPVRVLRRRVSECLDEALLPRQFEVPFVGRDREFRALRECFVATRNAKSRRCVVTGEAGIGKTRIAQELQRLAVLDGAMTIGYSCTSGDAISPLSSLLSISQSLLSQPGALGCASEHLEYLRRLHSHESTGIGSAVSGDVAYAQLVYSLAELVAAIADEGPLLLFVDDAHRLHQTSWRMFCDVVDRSPNKRIMLVLVARQLPDWYGTLGSHDSSGRVHHIALAPLTTEAAQSFLALWSEKNDVLTAFTYAVQVTSIAAGNPFYLGELLAHTARGGSPAEAPASIVTLVQQQFASLSRSAQRALLVTALLQGHGTIQRLASVLRLAPDVFARVLAELEVAGMLVSQADKLRLRHDLIGDIAMSISPVSMVQFLRMRVALRLEREGHRSGNVELLDNALSHWERCGSNERAFRAAMSLGSRLLSVGLSSEAAIAFQKARGFAGRSEERAAAFHAFVAALALANDWPAILSLQGNLSQTEFPALTPAQRDDIDLAFEEAQLWSLSAEPSFGALETLYADEARQPGVRARAALLALIGADNTLQGPAYVRSHEHALRAAEKIAPREDDRLLLAMLISVAEGTRDRSLATASELRHRALSRPPGERVRLSRLAAHTVLRNGRTSEALALFNVSLDDARALRLNGHELSSLEMVIRCQLQVGEFQAAARALEEFKSALPRGDSDPLAPLTTYFFESLLAMSFRDYSRAALARAAVSRVTIEKHVVLERHVHLFAKAALSFAYPDLLDEGTVSQCLTFDRRALTRGGYDLSVVAVANALFSSGQQEEAAGLISDYMTNLRAETAAPSERVWSLMPPALMTSCDIAQHLRARTG